MTARSRTIAGDPRFQHAALSLIVLNAVVMGLETSPGLAAAYAAAFWWFHVLVQAAFVVEIGIRLLAHAERPAAFFRDLWNTFDFVVVAAALVPAVGPLATIARLARILRIARVLSAVPELRLIVGTMLRSIPAMGHVLLLLGLLLYGYGIVGVSLFGPHDPARWGSLGRALMTLFEIMTLEGWVDMMEASLTAMPWAWIFYVSFIVVTVFIVVNLFIAVVINNLDATKADEAAARRPAGDLAGRLRLLKEELAAVEAHVRQGGIGS